MNHDDTLEQAARLWRDISNHSLEKRLGRALRDLKGSMPHGSFQDLCRELAISPRTARRYMAMAGKDQTITAKPDRSGIGKIALRIKQHRKRSRQIQEDELGEDMSLSPALRRDYRRMTKLARELGLPTPCRANPHTGYNKTARTQNPRDNLLKTPATR
jgi:hypothetical protein